MAPGCPAVIPIGRAFCGPHWDLLSFATQRLALLSYRPGVPEAERGAEWGDVMACVKFDLHGAATRPANPAEQFVLEATQTYTRAQVRAELEREIEVRVRVYPGWVKEGKLSKKQAAERIGILRQILDHGYQP